MDIVNLKSVCRFVCVWVSIKLLRTLTHGLLSVFITWFKRAYVKMKELTAAERTHLAFFTNPSPPCQYTVCV